VSLLSACSVFRLFLRAPDRRCRPVHLPAIGSAPGCPSSAMIAATLPTRANADLIEDTTAVGSRTLSPSTDMAGVFSGFHPWLREDSGSRRLRFRGPALIDSLNSHRFTA